MNSSEMRLPVKFLCWTYVTFSYILLSKFANVHSISTVNAKIKDEKCITLSDYSKPKKDEPCKDLGQCFQYRCGAVARHCSVCGQSKGPCIDFSAEGESSRKKRSVDMGDISSSPGSLADFLESLRTRMKGLVEQVKTVADSPPVFEPTPISSLSNNVVHIRAGLKNCAGFVTTVNGAQGIKHLILTAAQCLINFEAECRSDKESFGSQFVADPSTGRLVDEYMTYTYNHSWPCFGDYDSEVTRVKKSFRSYVAHITSYTGKKVTIPLTTKHVIIPRDYMECQDCRYDFAAIKLRSEEAQSILRGRQPFTLAPDKAIMNWKGDLMTQVVTVKRLREQKWRKNADSKFCTVSHATDKKLCFKLPLPPNVNHQDDLLPGSPLFKAHVNENNVTEYHCIGIFTGTYGVNEDYMTTDNLLDDRIEGPALNEDLSVRLRYSQNGAVRITEEMITLLEKLSGNPLKRVINNGTDELVTYAFPERRECFPSISEPYDPEQNLCLCALGWKDESDHCKHPDFKLTESCTWDGKAFACDEEISNEELSGSPDSILHRITIPGTVQSLSLRGQRLSDLKELATALHHLPDLKNLDLDYNSIQSIVPGLLSRNPKLQMLSVRHNGITRVRGDIFWRNPDLRHINFDGNLIRVLPADLLIKNLHLKYFNIANNTVAFITPSLFRKNFRLEHILLGYNNITFLGTKLLHVQPQLKEFRVNNNNIGKILNALLVKNRKLTSVDFSFNKLKTVSRTIFDSNANLEHVNFNNNSLTAIPLQLFSNKPRLNKVSALKNPLQNPELLTNYFENRNVRLS